VKWWLKNLFSSDATVLPAPNAVTRSSGQHQLPIKLGIASSIAKRKLPPGASTFLLCSTTVLSLAHSPSGCQLRDDTGSLLPLLESTGVAVLLVDLFAITLINLMMTPAVAAPINV